MKNNIIRLQNIGTLLETRFSGAAVREKIERMFNDTQEIILDCNGVEVVTKSFADECYAKLLLKFSYEEIRKK